MANPLYELNKFIFKFRNLWHAGKDARFCLETKAGKATVSLHLDLGDPPPTPGQPYGRPYHRRNSLSQQRRLERRAAARLAGQAGVNENAEEAATNDIVGEKAEEATTARIEIVGEKAEDATENKSKKD